MTEPTAAAPVCYRHTDRETWIRCQRCENPICPDCMTPAAVGFQCPTCVKDGAKSTRTGRLPYGGERSANPALTSLILIAINIAVWVMIRADGEAQEVRQALWLLPQSPDLGNGFRPFDSVAGGEYWQVLTSAFAHIDTVHIAFNMVALYFLGPHLEAVLGRVRFLALYLVSALTGSAAVMLLSTATTPTLGASGAIFGLLGALIIVAIKIRGDVQQLFIWLGINVVYTFVGSNISWQGHLGGLVGGALIAAIIVYSPKERRPVFQWSGIAAVAILTIALIAARAAVLA